MSDTRDYMCVNQGCDNCGHTVEVTGSYDNGRWYPESLESDALYRIEDNAVICQECEEEAEH